MCEHLNKLIKLANLGHQLAMSGANRLSGVPVANTIGEGELNFDRAPVVQESGLLPTGTKQTPIGHKGNRLLNNIKNRAPKTWNKYLENLNAAKSVGAVPAVSPLPSFMSGRVFDKLSETVPEIKNMVTGTSKDIININPIAPEATKHEIGHLKDLSNDISNYATTTPDILKLERNATNLSGISPLKRITRTGSGLPISNADAYTSYIEQSNPFTPSTPAHPHLDSHIAKAYESRGHGKVRRLLNLKQETNLFTNPEQWRSLPLRTKIEMLRHTKNIEAPAVEQAFGIPAQKYYNRLKEMLRFALKRRGVI